MNDINSQVYYYRGNDYSKSCNYQKAIENYNKAIKINPNDVKVYNYRGTAY